MIQSLERLNTFNLLGLSDFPEGPLEWPMGGDEDLVQRVSGTAKVNSSGGTRDWAVSDCLSA